VSHIKNLLKASYGQNLIETGQESIETVLATFVSSTSDEPDIPVTPVSAYAQPEKSSFGDFWGGESTIEPTITSQVVVSEMKRSQLIAKEIDFFNSLILNSSLMTRVNNSTEFWRKYEKDMPLLSKLFTILDNIPAASAQIERFFSMTGLICDKRRLRMTNKLIVMRSMFKANMDILESLN